jgi:Ricin-type beta-trefoil lectin domain
VVAVFALSAAFLSTITAHATGIHEFRSLDAWSAGRNECLWSPNKTLGTTVELYTCYSGGGDLQASEEWNQIELSDGALLLINQYSGLCLDIHNNSQSNGALATQWTCDSGDQAEVFILGHQNYSCPYGEFDIYIEDVYNSRNDLSTNDGTTNYSLTDWWTENTSKAETWCQI